MSRDPMLVSRRDMLGIALAALVPGRLSSQQEQAPQDEASARLPRPDMAGLPRTRVTDYENDPFIVNLESQIRCTCGCNLSVYTCRTTDFTCQTSPAMHGEVIALVEDDRSAEEILNAFVARHGESVLMAPPRRGFNIAAYVVPGIVITTVGAGMTWILSRRIHRAAEVPASPEASAQSGLTQDEAELIQRELEQLES